MTRLIKGFAEKKPSFGELYAKPHFSQWMRKVLPARYPEEFFRAITTLESPNHRLEKAEALVVFYNHLKMAFFKKYGLEPDADILILPENVRLNFQKFLRRHLPIHMDLRNITLSNASFPCMVFVNTDLTGATLETCDFSYNVWEQVSLFSTRMQKGMFRNSQFCGVQFDICDMSEGQFPWCCFTRCKFSRSRFASVNFMSATFNQCRIEENDFNAAGFLRSNFSLQDHPSNWFLGVGKPDTELSRLKPFLRLKEKYPLDSLKISFDNRYIVTGSAGETIRLWNLEHGCLEKTITDNGDITPLTAITPDNLRVLSTSSGNWIKVWEIKTGKLLAVLKGHLGAIGAIAVSQDGRWLVTGGVDKTVRVWSLDDYKLERVLNGHGDIVSTVAISRKGEWIVSGGHDMTVIAWSRETGCLVQRFEGHRSHVTSVDISSDNRFIVSGGDDCAVKIWERKSGKILNDFRAHDDFVTAVSISPDNLRIISSSEDDTVKMWAVADGALMNGFVGHKTPLRDAVPQQNSECRVEADFANADEADENIYEISNEHFVRIFSGSSDFISPVSLGDEDVEAPSLLKNHAPGSRERWIGFSEISSSRLIKSFINHSEGLHSVAISRDARFMATTGSDNTMKCWDIENGCLLYSVALLPGEQFIYFKKNRFRCDEESLKWLCYSDSMASYPASDLPELSLKNHRTRINQIN